MYGVHQRPARHHGIVHRHDIEVVRVTGDVQTHAPQHAFQSVQRLAIRDQSDAVARQRANPVVEVRDGRVGDRNGRGRAHVPVQVDRDLIRREGDEGQTHDKVRPPVRGDQHVGPHAGARVAVRNGAHLDSAVRQAVDPIGARRIGCHTASRDPPVLHGHASQQPATTRPHGAGDAVAVGDIEIEDQVRPPARLGIGQGHFEGHHAYHGGPEGHADGVLRKLAIIVTQAIPGERRVGNGHPRLCGRNGANRVQQQRGTGIGQAQEEVHGLARLGKAIAVVARGQAHAVIHDEVQQLRYGRNADGEGDRHGLVGQSLAHIDLGAVHARRQVRAGVERHVHRSGPAGRDGDAGRRDLDPEGAQHGQCAARIEVGPGDALPLQGGIAACPVIEGSRNHLRRRPGRHRAQQRGDAGDMRRGHRRAAHDFVRSGEPARLAGAELEPVRDGAQDVHARRGKVNRRGAVAGERGELVVVIGRRHGHHVGQVVAGRVVRVLVIVRAVVA